MGCGRVCIPKIAFRKAKRLQMARCAYLHLEDRGKQVRPAPSSDAIGGFWIPSVAFRRAKRLQVNHSRVAQFLRSRSVLCSFAAPKLKLLTCLEVRGF